MGGSRDEYFLPTTAAPRDASGFLRQWQERQDALAEGKTPASECSNFSYDAIAECLMDDDIRGKYDVLQAGTMNNQHNIAILVPKGLGASFQGGNAHLPEGSLIIDPWARAMGHGADAALFVSPEEFCYRDSLYPTDINFNSAAAPVRANPFAPPPKPMEEAVREFKESSTLKQFFNAIRELIDLDAHGQGQTSNVSRRLATAIAEAIGLDEEGVAFTSFSMDRGANLLTIKYTSPSEGEVTVDQAEFIRRHRG
jgi:hypothetical protein